MGEVWRARGHEARARGRRSRCCRPASPPTPTAWRDSAREAQILASLGHSGIASIYGLEESEGTLALAMELVAGEDLSERLARGPLPLEEALAVARQIAEALEEAHGKGIVHRDLKPANIKLTPDGKVKVLDFGLAKAFEAEPGKSGLSSDSSRSPTMTGQATQAGVILGTAAYMSPEQARGKPVDKRADVWSFGVVLCEMLTGRRLFAGETVSDTLAAVLRADPEWTLLRPRRPPRSPTSSAAASSATRAAAFTTSPTPASSSRTSSRDAGRSPPPPRRPPSASPARRWTRRAAVFLLGALAMAPVLWAVRRGPAPAAEPSQPTSFRQLTFLAGGESSPALAPDGESFAYVKEVDGQQDVFLQRVGGATPVNLTAGCAEDDDEPAFSPDGKRIAYRSECAGGGIFVMGATGESARKVTDRGHNPCWSPDGLELAVADEKLHSPFGRGTTSHVWAVRVETGERRLLAGRDGIQPSWSPDGRRIAFWGVDDSDLGARPLHRRRRRLAVRRVRGRPGPRRPTGRLEPRLVRGRPLAPLLEHPRRDDEPLADRRRPRDRPPARRAPAGHRPVELGRQPLRVGGRPPDRVRRPQRPHLDPSRVLRSGRRRDLRNAPLRGPRHARGPRHRLALARWRHAPLRRRRPSAAPLPPRRPRRPAPAHGGAAPGSAGSLLSRRRVDRLPDRPLAEQARVIRPDGSGLHELVDRPEDERLYPDLVSRRPIAGRRGDRRPVPDRGRRRKGGRARRALRAPRGSRARVLALLVLARRPACSPASSSPPRTPPSGAAIYSFADRSYRRVPTERAIQLLFLPDGKRVLAVSPRALAVVDLESGASRTLVTASGGLADGAGGALPRRPPPRLARARRRVGHLARRVRGEEVTTAPVMHMNHAYLAI